MKRKISAITLRLFLFMKKQAVAIFIRLLYCLLYLRIISLKIRHLLLVKRKKVPTTYTELRTILQEGISGKSIFLWNFKDSTARRRIYFIITGFALIFLTISIRLIFVASSEYVNYRKSLYARAPPPARTARPPRPEAVSGCWFRPICGTAPLQHYGGPFQPAGVWTRVAGG